MNILYNKTSCVLKPAIMIYFVRNQTDAHTAQPYHLQTKRHIIYSERPNVRLRELMRGQQFACVRACVCVFVCVLVCVRACVRLHVSVCVHACMRA